MDPWISVVSPAITSGGSDLISFFFAPSARLAYFICTSSSNSESLARDNIYINEKGQIVGEGRQVHNMARIWVLLRQKSSFWGRNHSVNALCVPIQVGHIAVARSQ